MTALTTWSDDFKVFDGTIDVSIGHGVVYSVVSQEGCTVSIDANGHITCTAITTDTARAVLQAVYNGATIQRVQSFAKARAGVGYSAKLLTLLSNSQSFTYNGSGAAVPSGQVVTFTTIRQGTSAPVSWTITDASGTNRAPVSNYLTVAGDGLSATLSEAQFASARNGTPSVTVTATAMDGSEFRDSISVVRIADGAVGETGLTGPTGNSLIVTANKTSFTYIDGALNPTTQSCTLTATTNLTGTISWTTTPNIKTGTGSTFTINQTEFGGASNMQVIVTATVAGVTQICAINRQDKFSQTYLDLAAAADTAAIQAKTFVDDVADSNTFSSDEKKRYVALVNGWTQTIPAMVAKANAFGLTSVASTLNTAWTDFYNYLVSNHYTQVWTSDTISRSTMQSKELAFQNALTALSNALHQKSSEVSTWAGVSGTGKPQDNATYGANLLTNVTNSSIVYGEANAVFNGGLSLLDGYEFPLGWTRYQGVGTSFACSPGSYGEGYFIYMSGSNTAGTYSSCASNPFYCAGGFAIQIQGQMYAGGVTSGLVYLELQFATDAAFTNGTGSTNISIPNGTTWSNFVKTVTVPAGTVYGRAILATYSVVQAAPNVVAWRKIKVCANSSGGAYLPFTDEATDYSKAVTTAGSGRQIGDQRNLPVVTAMNVGYKFGGAITYSSTSTSATISIAAGSAYIGSVSINYNAMSVSVSGSPSTTVSYFLYVDDPKYEGGTRTLIATTNGTSLLQYDGRVFIGYATVNYPSSGTSGGTGGGGGGGCVVVETVLPTGIAGDVRVGDFLRLGSPLTHKERDGLVSYSERKLAECVRITTATGIQLECSNSAPIGIESGEAVLAPDLLGHRVSVRDHGRWGYDTVASVEAIGLRPIQHITCEDDFFLAGKTDGRYLCHHNIKPTDNGL